jgi:hypothetical protein
MRLFIFYYLRPQKNVILGFQRVKQSELWLNYIKKYKAFLYKINIIRLVIEYIFKINLFRDININTIYYKFCQNWAQLTDTDNIIALFCGRMEGSTKLGKTSYPL